MNAKNKLKVFSGRANIRLAENIASYLGDPLGKITLSNFPDGEISVRIEEDVRGRDVFVVQPTCPPVNEHLIEPGKHFAAGGQVREVLEVLTEVAAIWEEMRKVRRVSYREGKNGNQFWTDLTAFAQEVETEVEDGGK